MSDDRENKTVVQIQPRKVWIEERMIELSKAIFIRIKFTTEKDPIQHEQIKIWMDELSELLEAHSVL